MSRNFGGVGERRFPQVNRLRAAVLLASSLGCGTAAAVPLTIFDFALFGGGGSSVNGTSAYESEVGQNSVVNGRIGSNEDVHLVGGAKVLGDVYAGRNLDIGSNAQIGADGKPVLVVANGVADSNGYVYGNFHSGSAAADAITMLLRPADAPNAEVSGSVFTKGSLKFSSTSGTAVTGNATVGGAVQNQASNTIGGTQTTGSSAGLLSFAGVAKPVATSFSASANAADDRSCTGASCTQIVLNPQTYRDLEVGTNKALYLKSGNYYFNKVTVGGGTKVYFDLSSNAPINIYAADDVDFGSGHEIWIKRPGDAGYTRISSLADKSIASLIYVETKKTFDLNSGSEWAGTVYASLLEGTGPEVHVGENINAWGAFYAFDSVDVQSGTTINYVESYRGLPQSIEAVAPAPASFLLLATGLVGVLGIGRSRT